MIDPLEQLDLSDLPDYDPEQEYQALVRAVRRQEGFGIIFVRCSPEQGHRLIKRLQQDLSHKPCGVLTLAEALPAGDFFGQAADFLTAHPVDVVFVEGIEHSLLDYEETKRQSGWSAAESRAYSWKDVPPILRNLNQQRDKFRNQLPACFIFLIPLFVVRYLTRRAPDFFDWRSGVFEFRDPQEAITQKIQECFLEDYEAVKTTTHTERTWQSIKIRDLLDEDSITPDERFRLLFDLAIIQSANGSYGDARVSLDKALEITVTTAENLNVRGLLLDFLRHYEESIASYDKAVDIKPDFHQAWNNRGISLKNLGRYEEAIASFDKALEIKPDKHDAWYNRGISLYNLGRYEEAIASYDKALEIKPDDHQAWNNRGISLYNLGRYEEAIASYDKALEIKPDKHEAWYNRGISLHNLGRYEEAIASYDKAVEIKPDYATALANRGDTFRRLGQSEQALSDLNRAIELKPDYPWAIATRAQTYAQIQEYELALQDIDHAIALDPDYRWARSYRGELCLWLRQYAQALEVLNQKIEQSPNSDWGYYLRALAVAKVDESKQFETSREGLNIPTTHGAAKADLTQAIQLAQVELEEDASNWYAHFNLALYHAVAGHHQAAQALYETGLKTAPSWAIKMAYRDLRDYLHLFPKDETAQAWKERFQNQS